MDFFIDEDMAYLFGLIVGRGTIKDSGGLKQIIISFPYKSLEATGIEKKFNQRDKILISLDNIVNRIGELVGEPPRKIPGETTVDIIIDSHKNSLLWRNVTAFTHKKKSFMDIEIHPKIFAASEVIKKEFIRGIADVTAYARSGNVFTDGRHRIYFEIHNANWQMPVQLCTLLQSEPLCIPVQTIDWGHPNIRNGYAKEYNTGRKLAWAREHQLKVFAEYFEVIGFRVAHKNEILKEMADFNRSKYPNRKPKLCSPPKQIRKQKVSHPEEQSNRLPEKLRGKHSDAYWQICKELGCVRYDESKINVENDEGEESEDV
jgi:hypothetical protein